MARVVEEIRSFGCRSLAVMGDVSDSSGVQAVVEQTVQELGGLNILVNNAGVESVVPFLEMPLNEWERVTGINLKGTFLCSQAAAQHMVAARKGGSILNIGSVQAGMALPGRTHYASSKRALEALTANLALELAPHEIRVNCLHPGLVDTPMTAWLMEDSVLLTQVLERIALRRPGHANEIGRAAVFFVSGDANYITGQSLYVDGGFRIL